MSKTINTITIQGSTIRCTTKETTKPSFSSTSCNTTKPKHKKKEDRTKPTDRMRGLKRSRNNFAQKVGAIKNRPTYHISLIIPGRLRSEHEAIVLEAFLKIFFKRIQRLYPASYLIRVYDWSIQSGLHAHILIRFGKKENPLTRECVLRQVWAAIVKSSEQKLFCITKYSDATKSYFTKPKKYQEQLIAIERLNGRRLWTIIGSSKIIWHKKQSLKLSTLEIQKFKSIASEEIDKYELPKSNQAQLKKGNFCLNYLPTKIALNILKKFIKWRRSND